MDNDTTKRCKNGDKCVYPLGALQPADKDHFWPAKENKDGLLGTCKACKNAQRNERYNTKPSTIALRKQAEKRKAALPPPDVRRAETLKRYADNHPDRIKKSKRDWKLRNPDKVRAYGASPRAIQTAIEWAKTHPDRRREIEKEYRQNNKHIVVLASLRRRTRKLSYPVDFTKQDWKTCLTYWDNRCAYCGSQQGFINSMKITAEHFVPLNDPSNPGTVRGNIIPACKTCNSSKSDKPAAIWLTERYGKRKANAILKRIQEYFRYIVE